MKLKKFIQKFIQYIAFLTCMTVCVPTHSYLGSDAWEIELEEADLEPGGSSSQDAAPGPTEDPAPSGQGQEPAKGGWWEYATNFLARKNKSETPNPNPEDTHQNGNNHVVSQQQQREARAAKEARLLQELASAAERDEKATIKKKLAMLVQFLPEDQSSQEATDQTQEAEIDPWAMWVNRMGAGSVISLEKDKLRNYIQEKNPALVGALESAVEQPAQRPSATFTPSPFHIEDSTISSARNASSVADAPPSAPTPPLQTNTADQSQGQSSSDAHGFGALMKKHLWSNRGVLSRAALLTATAGAAYGIYKFITFTEREKNDNALDQILRDALFMIKLKDQGEVINQYGSYSYKQQSKKLTLVSLKIKKSIHEALLALDASVKNDTPQNIVTAYQQVIDLIAIAKDEVKHYAQEKRRESWWFRLKEFILK